MRWPAIFTRQLAVVAAVGSATVALLAATTTAASGSVSAPANEPRHAPGRCAMYGQCGGKSSSVFAQPLNCPTDREAVHPDSAHRARLVEVCGEAFRTRPVCCDTKQLDALQAQTKIAYNVVSACPACWNNFLSFFCEFTCSPDQSTFMNVTATQVSPLTKKRIVTEADIFVEPAFGEGFYNSCKDVKFPSDNGFVMNLIGGGAKDYHGMLKFMGTERTGGSPFQLNFPRQSPALPMLTMNATTQRCNATDYAARCSCVDCGDVCPQLESVPSETDRCHVGKLACWPFALIVAYLSLTLVVGGAIWAVRRGLLRRDSSGFEPVPLSSDEVAQLSTEGASSGLSDHAPGEHRLGVFFQRWFYRLGFFCASNPWQVIIISVIAVGICSLGWSRFQVDTAPEKLWVGPNSEVARQKAFFDEHFSPFYRTEQLILSNADGASTDSVVTEKNMRLLFRIQKAISEISNITLDDLCLKPTGDGCVIQSVTGYWSNDEKRFDSRTWARRFRSCTNQPSGCLPDFQQPIKPDMVLGGFKDADFMSARALIVTYVLRNSIKPEEVARASLWENAFVQFMRKLPENKAFDTSGVRIDFSSEISVEQELNKSSNTDIRTVVISYIAMFLYVSLALGHLTRANSFRRLAVESKFQLGVGGILIVLASVSVSVGIFSFAGWRCTLIIAEVIPFLVLAVGVDNVFILVQEFQRQTDECFEEGDEASVQERCARTLARMGPSILLSAVAETIAFGFGGFVDMPAVSSFAVYAALAVWVDFMLQVTCFVACMALDAERAEEDRIDCFPCIRVPDTDRPDQEGLIQSFFRINYAPFILQRWIKPAVILGFLGLFFASLALIPSVELGLDQRVALPSDSYMISYFDRLNQYFRTGPPVYFVVEGGQPVERAGQLKLCGRFSTCDAFSLSNVLEQERKRPEFSYIAQPTASWLDDYFHWLNPNADMCCRVRRGTNDPCEAWDDEDECETCFASRTPPWNVTLEGMPHGAEFVRYLRRWLEAVPDEMCPIAGSAAYGDAITVDWQSNTVIASHFRSYHTPLKTQSDYIEAYLSARRIADNISERTGLRVFPYSIFYIFFAQYADIVQLTSILLGAAVLAIGLVTWLLLASLSTALIVMTCVIMIVVDVVGVMALWNVSLNAVSLVNLMICIGISVEFCCHIGRAFLAEMGGRNQRAYRALVDVGSSVFSGITITKLIGISILAFSRSKIFVIYYFRIYLAIVVLGALHGLVLLPVLLSLVGGDAPIRIISAPGAGGRSQGLTFTPPPRRRHLTKQSGRRSDRHPNRADSDADELADDERVVVMDRDDVVA
ncbi:patched family-domain-containing protein [Thamnocephalis sphaerospora]|uniref:Patched family-domain-containing protein n=1 Tax=Thamnocephalis sphaerospora TaxID=78915 RepID=A0A4P9XSI5_9FUNG|nr:patched family-domain-containing protein [Thamnocephalis sphaerospora]|eukprot:RKP09076.1 patched family-domain-containing protein [Thamnocephalis sphaerospora]